MQTASFDCEFETKSDGADTAVFQGIASTDDMDMHGDVLAAGCFLPIPMRGSRPDVLCCRDHDRTKVIGGWTRIEQDGKELLVEGELCLGVAAARETYALMQKGYLTGLSVGYQPDRDSIRYEKDRRTISRGRLREISVVAAPANAAARISLVKSEAMDWLIERGCTLADIEAALATALEKLAGNMQRRDQAAYWQRSRDTHLSRNGPDPQRRLLAREMRGLLAAMKGAAA